MNRANILTATILWCCFEGVEAAGKSIFKLGTDIDKKQWDVMGMYFIVFGITIGLELIVHKLQHDISSDSGKKIVHHITQEVMILGGIAAVLVVFENLGGTAVIDAPLFHYVHFVIFVMAIIFITLVTALFITVERAWDKWSRFENKINEIETDPSLEFNAQVAFLHQYVKSVPDGQRMLAGLLFFRQNLPGPLNDISYSRYMMKMQRKTMLKFLDLHGQSWALLAALCTLAAIVTYITLNVSDNELATIGLWTLFVGLGPLLVLVIIFFKIRKEYYRFTSEVLNMRMRGMMKPANHQTRYFWRSSPHFMEALLQTMLLYQVFFLSTAAVNFTYRLVNVKPYGWLLLVLCFLPSVFVFFLMVPLVLPPFTILSSLGDLLDHDVLLRMKLTDKTSGKYRRMFRRETELKHLAPFLEKRDMVVQKFSHVQMENAERRFKEKDSVHCVECESKEAVVRCNSCGILCDTCDNDYHKLRVHLRHKRRPLNEQDDDDSDFEEGVDATTAVVSAMSGRPGRKLHTPATRTLPPLPAYPTSTSDGLSAIEAALGLPPLKDPPVGSSGSSSGGLTSSRGSVGHPSSGRGRGLRPPPLSQPLRPQGRLRGRRDYHPGSPSVGGYSKLLDDDTRV